MSNLKRFVFESACYHTISVTRGRRPVFADQENAEIVLGAINHARNSGKAMVLAFAILPDHLHLVLVPRDGVTVSDVMKSIKNYVSTTSNRSTGSRGPLWQQSFYDRAIRNEAQLRTTIEYVHRNPLIAGVDTETQRYKYVSSNVDLSTDLDAFLGG